MPTSRHAPGIATPLAALLLALASPLGAQQATGRQAGDPRQPLAERVQRVMDRPEFKHATFGIAFYSLDDQRMAWSLNADKLFMAASTTKTLTEGTALGLLGADFRFHTRVFKTGSMGADGNLHGDIILVASGDPNLSGRIRPGDQLAFENVDHAYDASPDTKAVSGDPLLVIRALADQIAARGIKRISGRVLVDRSLFAEGQRELGTGVVISPIIVNDNLVDVMIGGGTRAGDVVRVDVSPKTSYVKFINQVKTVAGDQRARVTWSSDVTEPDGSHTVTISGVVPESKPAILYSYAVPEPSRFAEAVLVEALRDKGVSVDIPLASIQREFTSSPDSYVAANLVAEHISPPLSEEVKVVLKVSQNLHASTMPFILKSLLAKADTSRTGFDLEREFLVKAGLDLTGAQQSDGAGGDAMYTPEFIVSYLAYQSRQPYFEIFHRALPILGKDGTLWNIQTTSAAAGQVHAKTGTLSRYDALNRRLLVSAKGLAGYLTTATGRRYALAVYVNNVSVSLDPDEVAKVVGQAMGEIAAAGYLALP